MKLKRNVIISLFLLLVLILSVPDIKSPLSPFYFYILSFIISFLIFVFFNFILKKKLYVHIKLAFLLMLILVSLYLLYMEFDNYINNPIDKISLYEKRFDTLEDYVPDNCMIGYISEEGANLAGFDSINNYILTQYSLAPNIVIHSEEPDYIISNFPDNRDFSKEGLSLILDLNNGVKLFRRK